MFFEYNQNLTITKTSARASCLKIKLTQHYQNFNTLYFRLNQQSKFMKLKVTLLAVMLFACLAGFAQKETSVISVQGIGTVTAFPNAAQITLALKFVKPTLKEAILENQKASKEVLTVVKKYSADTTGIKVSLISTDKIMRWSNTAKKDVFVGFESAQTVIFTLNDLNIMQNFTEEIMKTRIYEIQLVSYFHTEGPTFIKQAQEIAVADAIETTKRLAKAAGTKLGKIVYIQTDSSPANSRGTTQDEYGLQTFTKGFEISGVKSSGQLINFTVPVTIQTEIN